MPRKGTQLLTMLPQDEGEAIAQPPELLEPRPVQRQSTRAYILALPREVRSLVAGGVAGMIAKTIVAPIDRIKILYQVSSRAFHVYDVPRVAFKIIQSEGISALWKGNAATMIRVFPYSGIQFMVFDWCKTFLLDRHYHENEERKRQGLPRRQWGLSPFESLVSGSVAGLVSAFSTYPLDMTRAQLAVLRTKKHQYNLGFVGVLTQNYKERGILGLYRGITPTLLGIFPYAGIAFAINEQTKRYIQNVLKREPTTVEKVQSGALSGLFAQTLTYPLEVTRRRMQTLGVASGKDTAVGTLGLGHAQQVKEGGHESMVWVLRELYKEQGIRGLFKGVSLNWMKGPVAFSISFTMFDIVSGLLSTDAERKFRTPDRKNSLGGER